MFFPEGILHVHVYGQPVDMRKSWDALYALTRHALGADPLCGALFAFINRRGNQIKILYWDRTGWCIWAKRLERGCFISDWSSTATRKTDWTGFKLLLEGIEVQRQKRRFKATGKHP